MQVLELPVILLAAGFGLEIAVGIALLLFSKRTWGKSSTASNARDPTVLNDTPFMLRAVTTTVLHDLHAPIQMVLGYCDMMLNPVNSHCTPLPAQFKTDILSIERNARQLGILIDQCFIEEQPT